jgi:hypothetical protein
LYLRKATSFQALTPKIKRGNLLPLKPQRILQQIAFVAIVTAGKIFHVLHKEQCDKLLPLPHTWISETVSLLSVVCPHLSAVNKFAAVSFNLDNLNRHPQMKIFPNGSDDLNSAGLKEAISKFPDFN